VLADARCELCVRSRVVAVDAAAEDGDSAAARVERAAVGLAVDATRHPAHDDDAGGGDLTAEGARDRTTVARARACTHHGDRDAREHVGLSGAPDPQLARWIVDRRQQAGIRRVAASEPGEAHEPGSSRGER